MNQHVPKKFEGFEIPKDPNAKVEEVGPSESVPENPNLKRLVVEGEWLTDMEPIKFNKFQDW